MGLLFVGPRKRVLFPCFVVFGAAALDTASWWLTRFVSPSFHLLSYITGGLFALGFAVLFVQIARANLRGLGVLATALCALYASNLTHPSLALAQDLDFDAPAVQPKKELALPTQVGPLSNLTLGGAIDWRVTHVNGQKRPVAFIHVNEFVVGANVGNHIAISAEQLLLTSETGTVVGQDHGFATVSLVQLPFLPTGMTVKLGRFRGKFGLDAQVDSPANIFPSQAVRSNGFITDVGVHLDYAFGDFEAILEVFNGPDFRTSRNGNGADREAMLVEKMPVQARFVYQPTSNVKVGMSGMVGETWDNQVSPSEFDMSMLGSRLDRTRTLERRRVAADLVWRTSWAEFFGEGIFGHDKGRLSQAPGKNHTVAKGALARVDVPLFGINDETRTKWAVQYDTW